MRRNSVFLPRLVELGVAWQGAPLRSKRKTSRGVLRHVHGRTCRGRAASRSLCASSSSCFFVLESRPLYSNT
ncbi:hypothetical protein FA95DRAFT_562799 [Auriscalpium vulgare]|uniref:Uncharacterized protein n=1 Tax=Auriscalpium vulgare TaxID=40419 RepID=A0ACB8REC2_9AGAM|nr:hypothetical protein FA95DRAFT_562799 [Auriscalpium vulgare]